MFLFYFTYSFALFHAPVPKLFKSSKKSSSNITISASTKLICRSLANYFLIFAWAAVANLFFIYGEVTVSFNLTNNLWA